MNKKLSNLFLCGVAILTMGALHSCKSDTNDLDTRLRVLETEWTNLQAKLGDAVLNGFYITEGVWNSDNTLYTLRLSNGTSIEIPTSGGTQVSVEIKDGVAVITIDGNAYEIPLGSSVSSLVYYPEYADGMVVLGNADVKVRFLATPIPTSLTGAVVEFVDVFEQKARTRVGSGELLVVNGNPALVDGYIEVPIKGINATANATYSAAIQLSMAGTTISSDYFTVKMTDDFEFKAEEINPAIKPKADFNPTANDDGSYTVTVDGLDLTGAYDFAAMFEGVPAGSTFGIGAAAAQTNGDAKSKQAMLARSMNANGTFEFAERPGTVFGDEGFLMTVRDGYTVIGKTFVKITDPLAAYPDIVWSGGLGGSTEPEYGARWKAIPIGPTELDLPVSFASVGNDGDATYDWEIIHGGRDEFFGKFSSFQVNAGDHTLIFHDGERLVNGTDEFVQKILTKSDGVYWYIKGICFDIPENFPDDYVYTRSDGQTFTKGQRVWDWGGPNPHDVQEGWGWNDKYTWDRVAEYGITMTKEGVIKFSEKYTGWGLRLTIGASFEWFYGTRRLPNNGNEFGWFFFNRRFSPEGATMPAGL